jgi:hypothetical protein
MASVPLTDQFTARIDKLALLFAGEPDENVEALLEAVCEDLQIGLSEDLVERIMSLVFARKYQIERNAMPVQSQ